MLTRIFISVVALSIAAPALADGDQFEKLLNVDPGEYTLSEMVQISAAKAGLERKQRIDVIMRNRDIERQKVIDVLNGTPGVTVTRAAR